MSLKGTPRRPSDPPGATFVTISNAPGQSDTRDRFQNFFGLSAAYALLGTLLDFASPGDMQSRAEREGRLLCR